MCMYDTDCRIRVGEIIRTDWVTDFRTRTTSSVFRTKHTHDLGTTQSEAVGSETMTMTMTTLGTHLDLALDALDSLSSTQLYALIVGLTVIMCWAVLSMSAQPDLPELTTPVVTVLSSSSSSSPGRPEPRWHFIQWANIVAVVVFAWSVADFSLNATTYWNDAYSSNSQNVLVKFLIGWSSLLCYFFAFFGVTFVHDLADVETQTASTLASATAALEPK
jgi:hypothetical protein